MLFAKTINDGYHEFIMIPSDIAN